MKQLFISCALSALAACAIAQPADHPNTPVYRSGPWFVVRSVRDGGSVVACTGFYRAKRNVQLSRDMLVIKAADLDVKGVAFAFDGEQVPAERPLSSTEKELKAIAFTGDDFGRLAKSHKVHIEATTSQGMVRHDLDLAGLAGALENINAGCPVPPGAVEKPTRGRPRSRH